MGRTHRKRNSFEAPVSDLLSYPQIIFTERLLTVGLLFRWPLLFKTTLG